ncbi:putative membrane protein [Collimonas fungivorans]|uniref:Putative membrane protein n=1 Tax=Collimonas fungivorans TaxID=158899 RepID=A0A127PG33_9BURK|nr:putative membrane protein [Collimonas fungivorans]
MKTASFYTKKSGAGFAVTAMAIVTVVLPERTGKYRRAHLNWISLTLIAMVICFQRRL